MNYLELLVLFTILISPASARSIPVHTLTPRYNISGLNIAAEADGKEWFGTATNISGIEQQDPYYVEQLLNWKDFGQATPANRMKFAFTEQRQGVFNLSEAEIFMSAVNPPGMPQKKIRCHPLVWHQTLPNWLTSPTTPWTNATLTAVLVKHVKELVSYFGDRCTHWDVVNEAFSESNTTDPAFPYRSINNIWYQIIGPEYISIAFNADSEERIECKAMLQRLRHRISWPKEQRLVQTLQARNIQINGVGFESHFLAGGTPNQTRQEQAMISESILPLRN
ncbi:Endo-1,4-beta-xylanase D [Pseudocercospora fuligena]|uniref:Beta-xylanase n=1 Tax=Pseudocercospora fuligena TaxID=685502 RepID=A0A8H6RLV1_9PEZI|nr:Endo-1,4-beta-xylanase D [Pseudocercospora fuligena]